MKITSFRLPTAFRPLALLSIGMTLAASPMARAQQTGTLATLYSVPVNGSFPGFILGSDGNFYGTTSRGGTSGGGTIFRLTPAGVYTTLYTFTGSTDGSFSTSDLVPAGDGSFYGTTGDGGTNGAGSVYRITSGGVLTTLYSFPTDLAGPAGLVLGSNGNFYGTLNLGGGTPLGSGAVFQITPAGAITVLAGVAGFAGGLVQGSDGNLYGTTVFGDTVGGGGTAFELTPAGVFTTLYTFAYNYNDTGGSPSSGLLQGSDGNFYGTTSDGGTNEQGTVYQLTPAGGLTNLYSFSGRSDGGTPGGLVQADDGNFYGTTSRGGTNNNGTVYQLTPAGGLTTLYAFTGNDGSAPAGLVLGGDGNFYGTTEAGGANGDGTIYQLTVISRPAFFTGQVPLGNGVYYLVLPDGTPFGYYSFLNHSDYIYHFDLGYEYVLDANDGKDGVYLFDDATDDFFYTSPTFPFPYLYDFGLDTVLYYYPDPNNPGHYNLDGTRTFYDFRLGHVIQN